MRGIGYFLGATVGAALMFAIISFIFLRPRKIKEIELIQFINNSNKIQVEYIPYFAYFSTPAPDERLGIGLISKMTYLGNRNTSYLRAITYTYFSDELNKHIRTYSISEGNFSEVLLDFGDKDKDRTIWPDMYFYYNKTQNADTTFGTLDKPLPILHFRSSDPSLRSMRSNNKDADLDYLKMVYEENVKLYLEYFIEKEDFKKLFPK